MTVQLIPDLSNWIFISLVVLVVVAGATAAVVAFSGMFKKVM
jgi:hypothetical protein